MPIAIDSQSHEDLKCQLAQSVLDGQHMAAEIERLRNENAHLNLCLNSRDDFIGKIGQWQAYVDTLPQSKAGFPNGEWSSEPRALKQSEPHK